jgi:hypothetical protein
MAIGLITLEKAEPLPPPIELLMSFLRGLYMPMFALRTSALFGVSEIRLGLSASIVFSLPPFWVSGIFKGESCSAWLIPREREESFSAKGFSDRDGDFPWS